MKRILITALNVAFMGYLSLLTANLIFDQGWTWPVYLGMPIIIFIFGIGYAFALRATMNGVGKSVNVDAPLNEAKLREGAATYIKGRAGFPGRLLLTDRQLIFKSKKIAEKDFEVFIELLSIDSLSERNRFLHQGHDLIVKMKDGTVHRLVVYAPEEWVADLGVRK